LTCIVAATDGHDTYMGADSIVVDMTTWEITKPQNRKLFARDGYLIGYAGSFRQAQILRYYENLPKNPWENKFMENLPKKSARRGGIELPKTHVLDMPSTDEVESFFVQYFVHELRRVHGEHNYTETDFEILIGFGPFIVEIQSDYSVFVYTDHAAIGVGRAYALGAMYHSPVVEKPERGLEASSHHNIGVNKPFKYMQWSAAVGQNYAQSNRE